MLGRYTLQPFFSCSVSSDLPFTKVNALESIFNLEPNIFPRSNPSLVRDDWSTLKAFVVKNTFDMGPTKTNAQECG